MSASLARRQRPRLFSAVASSRSTWGRPLLVRVILPTLLLVGAIAAIAYPFWPGRMSADSLIQIEQTLEGSYTNQYGPILLVMWQPFLHWGFGPGWILTLQLIVFAWGAHTILRRWYSPLSAAALTVVIMLTPQAFGEFGLLSRNTWFLSLMTACFACSLRALASDSKRRRWAWISGAIIFAWLTLASRQNAGASTFLPLAVLISPWISGRLRSPRAHRLRVVVLSTIAGLVVTLAMMASQSGLNRVISAHNMNPTAIIYLYDLSSLSRIEHRDLIPGSVLPAHSLARLDRLTNLVSANALIGGTPGTVKYPVSNRATATLRHAWLAQIEHHPGDYLKERGRVFGLLVGITGPSIWVYHPYIDPNTLGYANSFPGADSVANHYMRDFSDTANNGEMPFLPWPYLIACALIALGLARTRSRERMVLIALALAPLGYQIGLFFALMGANYTYEFPCIVLSELAIAIALRLLFGEARARRTHRETTTGARGPVATASS